MISDLPNLTEITLSHYKQHYNWDCGISCILMILPEDKRKILIKDLKIIGKQEEFQKRLL